MQARIKSDFGIDLPDVPEIDELDPADYFCAVAEAVAEQPRWEVLPNDMVLWFFSFAKFLMYRDLDTSNWAEESPLEEQPLIRSLLGSGFGHDPPLCGDSEKIDRVLKPQDTVHVLDADSSQALVIEELWWRAAGTRLPEFKLEAPLTWTSAGHRLASQLAIDAPLDPERRSGTVGPARIRTGPPLPRSVTGKPVAEKPGSTAGSGRYSPISWMCRT